ncbi:MAG: hydantoinase/oxoprolinase family protein [Candidatus Rokuibacteriota bacterium]
MLRIGCDIGGTFTDFVLLDEASGEIQVEKGLTTPADPSIGILDGLGALDRASPGYAARTGRFAHATTLIANAVIERKGARTALLCTRGFRDALELRRHVRVTTYELWADPPEPLVPRFLRMPVTERTWSDGRILTPVAPGEIEEIARFLRREGVESVAIAFLHAYVNPSNEAEVARLLGELLPGIAITTSAAVLPQIKEFERTSTTVVNAYVKPLARSYLRRLDDGIRRLGFTAPMRIMLSTGGVASTETAREFPVRLIESGPVAGAIVARQYAELLGVPELLSLDMGGTTAKSCLIRDASLPMTDELEVARSRRFTKSSGFPLAVPAVNLLEIGAGGGSIAAVNALDLLQVGPESAGADPGPICYGRGGTRPTVTDADLVLGYLNPAYFAGGTIRLDSEGAERGIEEHLARPLGRDRIAAAWTVHDVVNETMAAAVRMHVTERGGNPESATLFAFGGAGPVHACNLAAKLGMPQVIVPQRAGVLSALGLVIAPVAYDLVRTHRVPLSHIDAAAIDAAFRAMSGDVAETLRTAEAGGEVTFARAVDVGYIGQGYQVTIAVDASPASLTREELWGRFATVYREKYGYFYDDVPAELVNLRLSGRLAGRELTLTPLEAAGPSVAAPKDERPAFSPRHRRMVSFAVYDRSGLRPGMTLMGPAIIEEASATTVVDADGRVEVEAYGSLAISLGGGLGR